MDNDVRADTDTSIQDDVLMQQGYTSPPAEPSDSAGFFAPQSRDQGLVDEQQPQETEQPRTQVSEVRPGSRTSVSADELQLAAQLTQGLAPMMAAHNQTQEQQLQQVQEAETQQPRDPSYEDHSQDVEYQDQTPQQEDLHDQSQEAEQQYDDHIRDSDYQDQGQRGESLHQQLQTQLADHERELNRILQQQAQSQEPVESPYAAPPIQSAHLQQQPHLQQQQQQQQHILMNPLGQQYQIPDTNVPPRKRSKISRACDECRRKKIKCDASVENPNEPCSNCRRSSCPCLFSRVPQKRGPSKGYIKELADRINSIEGKLGSSAAELLDSVSRRESTEAFSSPLPVDENRKRPFSSISSISNNYAVPTPSPPRHTAWTPDHRPIQAHPAPPSNRGTPYSVNGLAPQPIGPKADPPRLESQVADSMQLDTVMGDLDEIPWSIYKSAIHPTFPILGSNAGRVQGLIARCRVHLREAFLEAFYAALKHTQELPPGTSGDTRTANKLLTEWEADTNMRSYHTDLVHLQTLLLMAMETDSHGPAAVKGHPGGLLKGAFIGRALALAYSMGLHTAAVEEANPGELDEDKEDKIALRAWWSLVMLDRWNAIGAGIPAQIPPNTAVILPGLRPIMGEGPYAIMHLSQLLGNFVPMAQSPPKKLGQQDGPILSSWVDLAIESFRLNLPHHITPGSHPVVHLAYWHCRLLAYLFMPSALSTDVLWAAGELVKLLTQHPRLRSPLNHHFAALAAATMIELSRTATGKTRDESLKFLKDLHDTPSAQSAWDGPIASAIAARLEAARRPAPPTETGSGSGVNHNLRHLADLATATTELAAVTNAAITAVMTGEEVPVPALAPAPALTLPPAPVAEEQQQQTPAAAPAPAPAAEEPPIKYRTMSDYEDLGFDPRPMLRVGYLNYFPAAAAAPAPTAAAGAAGVGGGAVDAAMGPAE